MWKLVYTIDNHYRDRDNYSAINIGDSESVTGETIDATIENLIKSLRIDKNLNSVIDAEALGLSSYDDCYNLNIVSFDEIKIEKDIDESDIFAHPLFKVLIDDRREEHERKKKNEILRKQKAERQRELRELKRLQGKYKDSGE